MASALDPRFLLPRTLPPTTITLAPGPPTAMEPETPHATHTMAPQRNFEEVYQKMIDKALEKKPGPLNSYLRRKMPQSMNPEHSNVDEAELQEMIEDSISDFYGRVSEAVAARHSAARNSKDAYVEDALDDGSDECSWQDDVNSAASGQGDGLTDDRDQAEPGPGTAPSAASSRSEAILTPAESTNDGVEPTNTNTIFGAGSKKKRVCKLPFEIAALCVKQGIGKITSEPAQFGLRRKDLGEGLCGEIFSRASFTTEANIELSSEDFGSLFSQLDDMGYRPCNIPKESSVEFHSSDKVDSLSGLDDERKKLLKVEWERLDKLLHHRDNLKTDVACSKPNEEEERLKDLRLQYDKVFGPTDSKQETTDSVSAKAAGKRKVEEQLGQVPGLRPLSDLEKRLLACSPNELLRMLPTTTFCPPAGEVMGSSQSLGAWGSDADGNQYFKGTIDEHKKGDMDHKESAAGKVGEASNPQAKKRKTLKRTYIGPLGTQTECSLVATACQNCGSPDHLTQGCHQPQALDNVDCMVCNRKGHLTRTCHQLCGTSELVCRDCDWRGHPSEFDRCNCEPNVTHPNGEPWSYEKHYGCQKLWMDCPADVACSWCKDEAARAVERLIRMAGEMDKKDYDKAWGGVGRADEWESGMAKETDRKDCNKAWTYVQHAERQNMWMYCPRDVSCPWCKGETEPSDGSGDVTEKETDKKDCNKAWTFEQHRKHAPNHWDTCPKGVACRWCKEIARLKNEMTTAQRQLERVSLAEGIDYKYGSAGHQTRQFGPLSFPEPSQSTMKEASSMWGAPIYRDELKSRYHGIKEDIKGDWSNYHPKSKFSPISTNVPRWDPGNEPEGRAANDAEKITDQWSTRTWGWPSDTWTPPVESSDDPDIPDLLAAHHETQPTSTPKPQSMAIPKDLKVTYWAKIESGEDMFQIPIDDKHVSGREKEIVSKSMPKVWKWVRDSKLGDKVGLEEAYELAKDMHGQDVKEWKNVPKEMLGCAGRPYPGLHTMRPPSSMYRSGGYPFGNAYGVADRYGIVGVGRSAGDVYRSMGPPSSPSLHHPLSYV